MSFPSCCEKFNIAMNSHQLKMMRIVMLMWTASVTGLEGKRFFFDFEQTNLESNCDFKLMSMQPQLDLLTFRETKVQFSLQISISIRLETLTTCWTIDKLQQCLKSNPLRSKRWNWNNSREINFVFWLSID